VSSTPAKGPGGRPPVISLALLLLLSSCSLLRLPFTILDYGFRGLEWLIANLGGLAPLAALLVTADPPPPGEAAPPPPLRRLLEEPPPGALALAVVPADWLERPALRQRLEGELRRRLPGAGGVRRLDLAPVDPGELAGLEPVLPILTPRPPLPGAAGEWGAPGRGGALFR